MSIGFWIKRALIVVVISFSVIFIAQYLKSDNLQYAFAQASLWGIFTTIIYLLVLWRKVTELPTNSRHPV